MFVIAFDEKRYLGGYGWLACRRQERPRQRRGNITSRISQRRLPNNGDTEQAEGTRQDRKTPLMGQRTAASHDGEPGASGASAGTGGVRKP